MEINSFANPYPYVSKSIDCFIAQFFRQTGNDALVEEYGLLPFTLNVLDKRQTLTEKLVSLIRFSLSGNYIYDVASKIRHFYDLHYLLQDRECAEYLQTEQFRTDFNTLLAHDRETFDKPEGWNTIEIEESPLLSNFPEVWSDLKETYLKELPAIAFSTIPGEDVIAKSFEQIINRIL